MKTVDSSYDDIYQADPSGFKSITDIHNRHQLKTSFSLAHVFKNAFIGMSFALLLVIISWVFALIRCIWTSIEKNGERLRCTEINEIIHTRQKTETESAVLKKDITFILSSESVVKFSSHDKLASLEEFEEMEENQDVRIPFERKKSTKVKPLESKSVSSECSDPVKIRKKSVDSKTPKVNTMTGKTPVKSAEKEILEVMSLSSECSDSVKVRSKFASRQSTEEKMHKAEAPAKTTQKENFEAISSVAKGSGPMKIPKKFLDFPTTTGGPSSDLKPTIEAQRIAHSSHPVSQTKKKQVSTNKNQKRRKRVCFNKAHSSGGSSRQSDSSQASFSKSSSSKSSLNEGDFIESAARTE